METVKVLFAYSPADVCEQKLDSVTTAQIQSAAFFVSHPAQRKLSEKLAGGIQGGKIWPSGKQSESGYTPVIPYIIRKTILSRCRSDVSYKREISGHLSA